MDHAKFCTATQGWSTPESVKPFALLRRRFLNKQEEDHVQAVHAMLLRGHPFVKRVTG
jgi:hypothetical protein